MLERFGQTGVLKKGQSLTEAQLLASLNERPKLSACIFIGQVPLIAFGSETESDPRRTEASGSGPHRGFLPQKSGGRTGARARSSN